MSSITVRKPAENTTDTIPYRPAHTWTREAQEIDREGSRFTSPIFSISVGKDGDIRHFSAHQSVLSQSPTLAMMCTSPGFSEAATSKISLPEDPPVVFALLIEYLYTLDFEPTQRTVRYVYSSPNQTWLAQRIVLLGELYVIAEKYMLSKLQDLITEKLYYLTQQMGDRQFFELGKEVYEGIPENRTTTSFFSWFESEARRRIRGAAGSSWMLDLIEDGGPFARLLGSLLTYNLHVSSYPTLEERLRKRRRTEDTEKEWYY